MKQILAVAFALLVTAACSQEPADSPDSPLEIAQERTPPAAPSSTASPPAEAPAVQKLTLDGLGALKIGQPVPAGSGWAEHGAQASDTCRTISSPDHPGVYAIVEGGKVRRVTLGERSTVKLAEGIGVGSTEAEVRAAFPGFRQAPHEYVDPPAKYLTAPSAEAGDPALRFEIGADGQVSLVHVGTMPVLGYVEGCA